LETRFAFQDLEVWQRAVAFADRVIELAENLNTNQKHFRLIEQLESAVTSIPMNVAEGKGRYSKKEFVHFLYIARGSLYETVTLLKIFQKRSWITDVDYHSLVGEANSIGKMISGLINSIKRSRHVSS